jgi:hypothetical protein
MTARYNAFLLALLVILFTLSLAGCGGGGGTPAHTPTPTPSVTPTTLMSEDFEAYGLTGTWTGAGAWTRDAGDGTYSIESDGTNVLGHVSGTTRNDILFYNATGASSWSNCSYQVRVKLNDGVDYAGVLRYNTGDYYLFYITIGSTINVFIDKGGRMAAGNYTIVSDTWYTLKMVFNGQNIKCYINGTQVLEITDPSMSGNYASGTIGLMSDDDCNTAGRKVKFDDIIVTQP